MNNIEITVAIPDQINDIMVIERLSFSIPWSEKAFVDEITRNTFARYITAKYKGKVVGYAGLWKVCEEGHITNIAVHPEFRGIGIGSLLMEKLIEIAKSDNITDMTLEVRKSNIAAQNLYKKYGFATEGFRKSYYADDGEDAVIMWKHGVQ